MDDWYRYYRAEIDRRGDEIKAAEKHRLMKLAQNDPYSDRAPKFYQRLFNILSAVIGRRGIRLQDQQPSPRKIYGHEEL